MVSSPFAGAGRPAPPAMTARLSRSRSSLSRTFSFRSAPRSSLLVSFAPVQAVLLDSVAQALLTHPDHPRDALDAPARADHRESFAAELRRERRASPRHVQAMLLQLVGPKRSYRDKTGRKSNSSSPDRLSEVRTTLRELPTPKRTNVGLQTT